MSSSTSSPKRAGKAFFEFRTLSAFDIFYQLTYMSAMASAGITRSKTFELASLSGSPAADYFVAVNTLVDEIRLDYPDACRTVGDLPKTQQVMENSFFVGVYPGLDRTRMDYMIEQFAAFFKSHI